MRVHRHALLALAALVGCGGTGNNPTDHADGGTPPDNIDEAVTPCADYSVLKNAYFGDLHTHTSYSLDAYAIGTRVDPAGAYAFAAKKSSVTIASGAMTQGPSVQIDRALDFLAVTDHSEFFNVDYGCSVDTASPYYQSDYCVDLRNQGSDAQIGRVTLTLAELVRPNPAQPSVCLGGTVLGGTPAQCAAEAASAWQRELQAVAAANNRCAFTSLVGYEWTATTGGSNLHRNVVFNSASVPAAPLDYINYPSTHALWEGLSQQCTAAGGCAALTIPHNSNLSAGQMFTVNDADVDYMTKYQTLVEITQHKGNSECLSDPSDSGYDAQCNFELLPGNTTAADKPGYVRSGLESGLSYYASHTGTAKKNPLQLGFVAATDTHNATPGAVSESTWAGHIGITDDTPRLRLEPNTNGCDPSNAACTPNANRNFNPGGVTGVWAEQNSRDRIFAALQRREVFGTSGPRIKVRFYQYWGTQNPCSDTAFPKQVVNSGGVPMGGSMVSSGTGSPSFVVYALKDTTDLAEIDIFKASVVGGKVVEQLQQLTVSGGSACKTWTDTGYSAAAPALYYARVLEQPTPRWSHYDCLSLQTTNPSDWQTIAPGCKPGGGLDVNIQERAWTSPIWRLP
jgi:Protein of unknown function (DUF3604)